MLEEVTTVDEWEENGNKCKLKKHPLGHYMGYVQVANPDTLAMEWGYPKVSVHGGITYGPDDEGWIGFDTAHAWDVSVDENGEEFGRIDQIYTEENEMTTVWTPDKVRNEIIKLARKV